MRKRSFKPLALSLALVMVATTMSCGLVLHPERKGTKGGKIDTKILVFDILWFIPGILPGAIMLAVDFATGCIYGSGDLRVGQKKAKKRQMATLQGSSKLLIKRPKHLDRPVDVELRVVTENGQVLDRSRTRWLPAEPKAQDTRLTIDLGRVAAALRKLPHLPKMSLELVTSDGQRRTVPIALQ